MEMMWCSQDIVGIKVSERVGPKMGDRCQTVGHTKQDGVEIVPEKGKLEGPMSERAAGVGWLTVNLPD